jgi:hypothetical protein
MAQTLDVDLPTAVRRDSTFSAVKDAAATWISDSSSIFQKLHLQKVESGTYASFEDMSKAIYYAVEHCALAGACIQQRAYCFSSTVTLYNFSFPLGRLRESACVACSSIWPNSEKRGRSG